MGYAAFAVASAALFATGCGCGLRSATTYSGSREPVLSAPDRIDVVRVLPAGYERLGRVSDACTLVAGRRALHGAWLSDVDCSGARLVDALAERAARVGGELLVGLECDSRPLHGGRVSAWCRAAVARPTDPTLAERALGRPEVHELGASVPASAAWRIRVDFSPTAGAPPRAARRGDVVHEPPRLPAGHVVMGEVVAHCRRGCSEDATRDAVRVTAGRMGATDAVAVHCDRRAHGWLCMGQAATYAVPPALDPSAW
jgi:hypothetical protein